jgi:ABC-type hemin transport system ATPase subunit
VTVLHDLVLAARFCDRIIALREGTIAVAGTPSMVLQPEPLQQVFDVPMLVMSDPDTGLPLALPHVQREQAAGAD